MARRLTARPERDGEQNDRHGNEEMRQPGVPVVTEPLEEQPCIGDAYRGHGERAGAQDNRRERRAGAPRQQRRSLVARQMVHLTDQRDRPAKGRGGDDP